MNENPHFTARQSREQSERWMADPANQRRYADQISEQKANIERYFRVMTPLLERLRAMGCEGHALDEMVENLGVINPDIVATLLAALDELSESPYYQNAVVSELMNAGDRFDGRPLVKLLESTDDSWLQDVICQVIARKKPHSIDDWLWKVKDGHWGNELRRLRFTKFPKKPPISNGL